MFKKKAYDSIAWQLINLFAYSARRIKCVYMLLKFEEFWFLKL